MVERRSFLSAIGAFPLAAMLRISGLSPTRAAEPARQRPGQLASSVRYLGHPPAYWVSRLNRDRPMKRFNPAWNRHVCQEVVGALSAIDEPAIPDVLHALDSDNSTIQYEASKALSCMKSTDAKAAMYQALKHRNPRVRAMTVWNCMYSRHHEVEVPFALEALRDDNAQVRKEAVRVLATCHFKAKATKPALERALHDPELLVRTVTAVQLAASREGGIDLGIDIDPEPLLIEALQDMDASVRLIGAQCAYKVTYQSEPVVSLLVELMNDPDASVREAAADSLYYANGIQKVTLALRRCLRNDPIGAVRAAAVGSFAVVDDAPNGPIASVVRNALGDTDPLVRKAAAAEIPVHFSRDKSLLFLAPLIDDDDEEVRSASAWQLGFHVCTIEAEPFFLKAMDHDDPNVRSSAASGFYRICRRTGRPMHPLKRLLKDPDARVRRQVASDFISAAYEKTRVLSALQPVLSDHDIYNRESAAKLLLHLERPGLNALKVSLKSSDIRTRAAAAHGLAVYLEIEEKRRKDKSVPAALAEASRDPDLAVRFAARGNV